MEEGRIKGEEKEKEKEEIEEYILDDMEEGQLSPDYLFKKMQRKREKEERRKMELANIPFSAFAQKTGTEKEIDAFHKSKAAQNLKYLNVVKNNEQYLKYNPTESLRERESVKPVTVYATIDPETGEPFVSHKDPDIRPLNLHGERLEEKNGYGFYAHDFDGGKRKTQKKNKRKRNNKTKRTRSSTPSRK